MGPGPADCPEFYGPLTLRSDQLDCVVLRDKGADIYSVVHRASGVDVLFKTPWGARDPRLLPAFADSRVEWLARYPGGWQIVLPHAGDPVTAAGVQRGFHGEAAVCSWEVVAHDTTAAVLETSLVTAPLRVRRRVQLDDAVLAVTDTVTNDSPVSVPVAWTEHVAFGSGLLNGDAVLETSAQRFVSDDVAPGTVLPESKSWPIDGVLDRDGRGLDLSRVPGPGAGRELFGTLTDFARGWCRLSSPAAGLEVSLDWDSQTLPHAWLWQELGASTAFPWFGRAHVVGLEPANVPTGHDPVHGSRRTMPPVLAGGASWEVTVRLNVAELG